MPLVAQHLPHQLDSIKVTVTYNRHGNTFPLLPDGLSQDLELLQDYHNCRR